MRVPSAVGLAIALAVLAPPGLLRADGDRVHPSPEAVRPLAVGASVPSAQVREVGGETVDLADLVREGGALLVFYRGGW